MSDLSSAKILIIVANQGVEQEDLNGPIQYLKNTGAYISVAAPSVGTVKTVVGDCEPGMTWLADQSLEDVSESEFDLLIIPGGVMNLNDLRTNAHAQRIVQVFAVSHKPIAATGQAAWLLADARVLNGKSLTVSPAIRTDVENAGGTVVDQDLFHCNVLGWPLLSSNGRGSTAGFLSLLSNELAEQLHK